MELIIDHSVDSIALALLTNYVQKQAKTAIDVTVFSREQWDLLKQSPQFSYYLKVNPKGEAPFLVNKTTKQVVIGPKEVQAAIVSAAPSANELFAEKKEVRIEQNKILLWSYFTAVRIFKNFIIRSTNNDYY